MKKFLSSALSLLLVISLISGNVFASQSRNAELPVYEPEASYNHNESIDNNELSADISEPEADRLPDMQYYMEESNTDTFSQPESDKKELNFAEDRVIVKLANSNFQARSVTPNLGVDFSEIRLINPSKSTGDLQTFTSKGANDTQNNTYVLTLEETGKDAVERALEILNANPDVEISEPDYLYELSKTPNDPQYNAQYALQKISAPAAWDIATGSKQVVVGVIDTGLEGTHPDLIDNLWVNPRPNQGGYVNDIHGYNFTGETGGIPTDTNGHGTHVVGIIGAKGNNSEGVCGINWDVSLAWMGAHAGGNSISIAAAMEALNYAKNHDIMITNNSYEGPGYSRIFEDAIKDYGGLFIASAGNESANNDTALSYPAGYKCDNIISVASTDSSDVLASSSNYGINSVDIAAPGNNILSTYLDGTYKNLSGISMASPYVAGVAALVKAKNQGYSPAQIKAAILGNADVLIGLADKTVSCFIYFT